MDEKSIQLAFDVSRVFTPGAPIDERALFAGRRDQIRQVVDTVSTKGQHAIIYGERGVGKTSLVTVLSDFLGGIIKTVLAIRVNCDTSDDYQTLWRKVFSNIQIERQVRGIGFMAKSEQQIESAVASLPQNASPEDIRRLLLQICHGIMPIIIFDEFDRIRDSKATSLLADTIKSLSDNLVPVTLVFVGVADSVDELIKEHQSIERALVQVHMPRMSKVELDEIVFNGLSRLSMTIKADALKRISILSRGLPYYTHLLSLHAARAAIDSGAHEIDMLHVVNAIVSSLDRSQQSIRSGYYTATRSSHADNLYKQVLLACALAPSDDFGFFTASSLRESLQKITGRQLEVPSYARHLKQFCEEKRGSILTRSGGKHRGRFRFSNPLMQPFVVIQGFSEKVVSEEMLS